MSVLREAVDDGEDDRLVMDLRKSFDEVHCNVGPYDGWQVQGLKQPGQL
jgi:hypothetical protein